MSDKSKNLKDQLARALADYDNLRKRSEKEKEVWIKFSAEAILVKLLTIFDILESVQKHLKDQGLAIAIIELRKIFEEEGLEEIDTKGNFDENKHEVVETIEGREKGKITEVVLTGWKFKDETDLSAGRQVVRHAKVKVIG
ncbi:nucleotide exchange factor GrpE [Candidatus Woesebacteria bacterium RIFCSPHIGHO2_01_FULL_39_28]|uniref:Protein GrpE n=1 Tax=Candidatus Woesebacteria bacterium RIFCSPHIGHO2_01_FULL_39_28 TaxID=1802496 RepID=A0A1F7YMA4_9BACT|nr:MAG: nucleotide exchange factor GrpE [Candidatus Woesebacteria bacterium RIFCSPHIGHO2_01_FULL_39_28]OGM57054.1 MAG: nucleotide exchange factor GrpE [Candidatus Woesebacteria bacterium RIFCSPLOWO2_01_FULL_38_20]